MIPEYVRGPIANVFTAWNQDGSFDPDGQRHFLDFLLQTGAISAFFVRSGMGQMYTFQYDDVTAMAELACGHLAGKAPVLVGSAGIWDRNVQRRPDRETFTRQAVELSRFAESVGAAGVVHTLPEAIVPEAGESHADVTLRYFETINDAVNVPIFIYQPPGTDPNFIISVELAPRLADIPNVKGMKASTPDAMYILDIIYATRGKDFGYIVGHEGGFYAGLCSGALAVIGQGCCLNPAILLAVQERFEAGDYAGAIDAQYSVNMLCRTSRHSVEFLKRYATEHGYPVKPYARSMGADDPYGTTTGPNLSDADYHRFKAILEAELAKYPAKR